MKRVYMNATGKEPANFKFPFWLLRLMNGEMAKQFDWNNEVGWHFGIQGVREHHPELISFDTFWKAQQRAE